jgi:cytoskeletal protein RodZ
MTTRDHARRTAQDRLRFGAGDRGDAGDPGPGLPDRLAAARERKGVDLLRAERDTKIRVRYLSALEQGEYRDLPGAVYTKGFLRNYAIYLGLDPEDVLRQWRRERGEATAPEAAIVPPRPLEEPTRPLNFSPSVVVAALLTAGVVLFFVYLGSQLLRYSKPPELSITNPATAVLQVEEDATTYRLAGVTSAGSVVTVKTPGRPDLSTTAQSSGEWSVQVDLRRGQNRFDVTARNPETGKEAETPRSVVITVPFQAVVAPTLTVSQPVDGTTYGNGAIAIEGTTTNAKTVTVRAVFLGAEAGAPASAPPATQAPAPTPDASGVLPSAAPSGPTQTVDVNDDGSFSMPPLELTAGRWEITVTATSPDGKTASQKRTITVAFEGVNVVVSIRGGPAWIKVWVDGKLVGSQAGQVYQAGKTLTFTGKTSVEVRTGSSGSTRFTLNGTSLGTLGKGGVPETWLFAPPAAPAKTQRT